jgi:A/G-specific adenine glycosylase
LFEFPLIESETPLDFNQLSRNTLFKEWFPTGKTYDFRMIIEHKKHVLSHRIIHACFYRIVMEHLPETGGPFTKIKQTEIDQYPVHRLMQYYLEKNF